MDTSTQEGLRVLRAQCGDRDALEQLLANVQPALYRYLRGVVGPADADDVLQEAFVLAFRKLKWLEMPRLFRPWLFRIASRVAFRHLKKRNRRFVEAEDADALASVAAPEPPSTDLLSAISTSEAVSPASRAVLLLHFQEELSLPDVATVLGLPLGTVKSRLAYGLAALRKELGGGRRK